eukprot:1189214-Prorocentrum_minimum.AAC.1
MGTCRHHVNVARAPVGGSPKAILGASPSAIPAPAAAAAAAPPPPRWHAPGGRAAVALALPVQLRPHTRRPTTGRVRLGRSISQLRMFVPTGGYLYPGGIFALIGTEGCRPNAGSFQSGQFPAPTLRARAQAGGSLQP